MLNYYGVLGVSPKATTEDIKTAYRALMSEWHPDRFAEASQDKVAEATRRAQQITEAWHHVSDPGRRSTHDHNLNYARASTHAGSNQQRREPREQPNEQQMFDRLVAVKMRGGWKKRAAQQEVVREITDLSNLILSVVRYPPTAITQYQLAKELAALRTPFSEDELLLAQVSLVRQGKLRIDGGNYGVMWFSKSADPIDFGSWDSDDWAWFTGTGRFAQ